MTNAQQPSNPAGKPKNGRLMSMLVIPLAGCLISSVVGIILGQMGNVFYKVLGAAGNCMALPGFFILFMVTFAISFLSNNLLRKVLATSVR